MVFKVDPSAGETVLHSFAGTDGCVPATDLLERKSAFYSTTFDGGAYVVGVVFKLQ